MQVRPPNSGPSTEYHPPLPPSIPLSAINTLIPRLTTTINDIDSLRNLIGSGYADGTLPSWDNLLQRYSLLLGRINALTNYLSPPPPPTAPGGISRTPQQPLSNHLIHPLNPLPSGSNPSSAELSPFAQEAFLQSINTQLLPGVTSIQSNLLNDKSTLTIQGRDEKWHSSDELRRTDERDLEILRRNLKNRLNKENLKIDVIKREIKRREEEVDWNMRIGEDEEDDDEEEGEGEGEREEQVVVGGGDNEKQVEEDQKKVEDPDEDEDDLFGGDDEDDDEPMIIDVDAEKPESSTEFQKQNTLEQNEQGETEKKSTIRNWKIEDYILFMDTGKQPQESV